MSSDETRTHRRWMSILSDLIAPQAGKRRGRVVKSTGDGVLVEFPSALDAIEWAQEVQRRVAPIQVEQDGLPATITLRIAVHLGDLMTTSFDVFGDGVNVAARLQEHGVPGGIIMSEAVHDLVRGTIGSIARDLGFLQLKNLEKSVRAYSLDPETADLHIPLRPRHISVRGSSKTSSYHLLGCASFWLFQGHQRSAIAVRALICARSARYWASGMSCLER